MRTSDFFSEADGKKNLLEGKEFLKRIKSQQREKSRRENLKLKIKTLNQPGKSQAWSLRGNSHSMEKVRQRTVLNMPTSSGNEKETYYFRKRYGSAKSKSDLGAIGSRDVFTNSDTNFSQGASDRNTNRSFFLKDKTQSSFGARGGKAIGTPLTKRGDSEAERVRLGVWENNVKVQVNNELSVITERRPYVDGTKIKNGWNGRFIKRKEFGLDVQCLNWKNPDTELS
jgi:hypothetical protein